MMIKDSKAATARSRIRTCTTVSTIALCGFLAACATPSTSTSNNSATAIPTLDFEPRTSEDHFAQLAYWGSIYEASPSNAEAATNYGRNLRYVGRTQQAVKILAAATSTHPKNAAVLAEYGKALTAAGRALEGLDYLARANTRSPRDWTNLSAEGVAFDH